MRNGKATLSVLKALLYYSVPRTGLDTDPQAGKPADRNIVIKSQQDFT